jgi:hypothetical protein
MTNDNSHTAACGHLVSLAINGGRMKTKKIRPNRYCIWIDQRKAIVGWFDKNDNWSVWEKESELESHVRFSGEETNKSGIFGKSISPQKQLQERRNNQIKAYVKQVAMQVKEPAEVLLLGPSTAKFELLHALQDRPSLNNVPIVVRTAEKKVRESAQQAIAEEHFQVSEHYHLL